MSAILSALLAQSAQANKPPSSKRWTATNKALAGAAFAGMLGDWLTTVDISRNRPYRSEMNPILGSQPSVGNVNTYFALATAGSGLIANALSPKLRNLFLGGLSAVELASVLHNRKIGLKFNFRF
jgi:hypothetical protein